MAGESVINWNMPPDVSGSALLVSIEGIPNKIVCVRESETKLDYYYEQGDLSIPCGHKDPGETALATAKRELLEEAGLTTDERNLMYVGRFRFIKFNLEVAELEVFKTIIPQLQWEKRSTGVELLSVKELIEWRQRNSPFKLRISTIAPSLLISGYCSQSIETLLFCNPMPCHYSIDKSSCVIYHFKR